MTLASSSSASGGGVVVIGPSSPVPAITSSTLPSNTTATVPKTAMAKSAKQKRNETSPSFRKRHLNGYNGDDVNVDEDIEEIEPDEFGEVADDRLANESQEEDDRDNEQVDADVKSNAVDEDILQVIPDDELYELRDMYAGFSHPVVVHSYIDVLINWRKRAPREFDVTFYAPHGDWRCDGTFVATMKCPSYDCFVFTLDPKCSRLYEGLLATKRFDWTQNQWLLYTIHESYRSIIYKLIDRLELRPNVTFNGDVWIIDKETAFNMKIDCPSEVYMKRLTIAESATINDLWPHKFDGSVRYVRALIKINGGVGVFLKDGDRLVAWILKYHTGEMGLLQTRDGYKRRGYATIATKWIARDIACGGHTPTATVLTDNVASRSMFKKLGFNVVDQTTVVQYRNL